MEYAINKGIGRNAEFQGLKSQYLFLFAGGLLGVFVLFVVMYMMGVPQWFWNSQPIPHKESSTFFV